MSVKEYSLKFIKLSKYFSSLVSNDRDEMRYYVMSVSKVLEEDCCASILHYNMDLSRLMVHAQVEDSRLRKKNREAKKARSSESSSSKSRLDVQDKSKFKKRFSNQFPSNFLNNCNDIVSNPKSQKGRNVDLPSERPTSIILVRNMWVNAFLGKIVFMVVLKVSIWLKNVLM